MTTILKLISMNKHVFNDFQNEEMEEIIKKYKKEFEEYKNSFPSDGIDKIQTLLLRQKEYLQMIELGEKDKYVVLALKIGIELGRYFEVLEDL